MGLPLFGGLDICLSLFAAVVVFVVCPVSGIESYLWVLAISGAIHRYISVQETRFDLHMRQLLEL